jgi:hypothetical protein
VKLSNTKKSQPEIKLGATVRLKAQSGEIVEGRVVHVWEDKSVPMVRVTSGDLVYNVPASMLVDEIKSEMTLGTAPTVTNRVYSDGLGRGNQRRTERQ